MDSTRMRRAERILAGIVLSILVLFFISIGVRVVTRQLVKRLGVDNWFTQTVFFDRPDMNQSNVQREVNIDWQALYPFDYTNQEFPLYIEGHDMIHSVEDAPNRNVVTRMGNFLNKFLEYISKAKDKIEDYATKNFMGYVPLVEMAKRYENLIQWNLAILHGIVKLPDGHLISYCQKRDVSEYAQTTINFSKVCKHKGIEFMYVNTLRKICKFEDPDISGVLDYTSLNMDDFLQQISQEGVKYFDPRVAIHGEGISHHSAFFHTDAHWLPTTAFWVAGHILKLLHDDYGWPIDPDIIAKEKFVSVTYPRLYLGAEGRNVTLINTTPDDFTLLYPKYPTSLRFRVPSINLEASGDFSILYDMSQINEVDYYNKSPYAAYAYGNPPLRIIENMLATNGIKLLVLTASFASPTLPFLAMGVKEVHAIDRRGFNGSIQNYIDTVKPDMVIVFTGIIEAQTTYDEYRYRFFDYR